VGVISTQAKARGGKKSSKKRDKNKPVFWKSNLREAYKMVSRRKILSRSRDELHSELFVHEEEDDVWLSKEKLYQVRKNAHFHIKGPL
jgi:hypothetical protein